MANWSERAKEIVIAIAAALGVDAIRDGLKDGVKQAVAQNFKRLLEDARDRLVPYFQKLATHADPAARKAAQNFFRNQRERQQWQASGGRYRPGDENRFMTLVAKIFLAMDPARLLPALPNISLAVSGKGKATDQVIKDAIAELQKQLQAFLAAQAAASGKAVDMEEERRNFFVWLFNQPDNEIEAILAAVEHDQLRQLALRVREDAIRADQAVARRLAAYRRRARRHGLRKFGTHSRLPWWQRIFRG